MQPHPTLSIRMSSLPTTAEQFVIHCRYTKSLSPHTARAYSQDLHDFTRFIGATRPLDSITSEDIEAYVQDILRRRSLSPATAKRRLGCLKVFFSWLCDGSVIRTDPLQNLKLPIRLPKRLPRLVTRDELRALLRATTPSKAHTVRSNGATHLPILLMASTGVRVTELVSLSLSDVDAAEGRIRIHGKGSRERNVYVTDPAILRGLKTHLRVRWRGGSENLRLFVNEQGLPLTAAAFRKRLHKAAISAAIDRRITPHMLRHTAATLLIEEGVDIRVVQRLLGHQSISTTELYTHVADATLQIALRRADLMNRVVMGRR